MKKTDPNATSKKLRLNRMTVRPLTTEELTAVAGGKMPSSKAETENQCQTVP